MRRHFTTTVFSRRYLLLGIQFFILFFSYGCARTLTIRDDSQPIADSANPVVLVQYRYEAVRRSNHAIHFKDAQGKDYKISVSADTDTESGVLFEVPSALPVKIVKFSHRSSFAPIDVEKFFPMAQIQAGRINHLGFLNFKGEDRTLYVGPMKKDESIGLYKKAVEKLKLSTSDVVNAYTGKPMALDLDTGVLKYLYVSQKKAELDYEERVWNCFKQEQNRNLIILGSLRFLVTVEKNRVSDIKLLRSEHTASEDFEICAAKTLLTAPVSGGSFQADVPIIF